MLKHDTILKNKLEEMINLATRYYVNKNKDKFLNDLTKECNSDTRKYL